MRFQGTIQKQEKVVILLTGLDQLFAVLQIHALRNRHDLCHMAGWNILE
jgi:succinate-acetate transporter protein